MYNWVYFLMLIEHELMNYNDDTQKYPITEKGCQFIKDYERLAGLNPEIDVPKAN